MYRDGFEESGLQRFLRALSASFSVGRHLGVHVRVYWIALVVVPFILTRQVEGLPFVDGLTFVVFTTLALYVVIWTHEMGHIVAGRRYGIQTPLITLSPLGGLAHMSSSPPTPRAERVVALAGPAVHVVWVAAVLPLYLLLDPGDLQPTGFVTDPAVGLVHTLLWMNVGLLCFNLLPVFPMDGGRFLRGLLAQRMHPNRATLIATRVGTMGAWFFIVGGIAAWILRADYSGPLLAAIGLSGLMACKQERLMALHSAGPYLGVERTQAWEQDPEAWKLPGRGLSAGSRARSERKLERLREKEREESAAHDEEMDRVLARVSEVGLDGLTRKERAFLEKASRRRRGG